MRPFFILAFIFFSLSLCAQQTFRDSILHDGQEREFILYIPESYTGAEAVPLVLNFHGYGSNATEQMWYGDFRAIADTAGFIVVHPQGTLLNGITHWNVGGWTAGSTVDDVGFVDALLDSLEWAYNIDASRIYATGMSNGGFMSFLLACQLSDRIAAIAPVAGSMTPDTYNACNPQRPVPVLQIHGTADPVVPYTGALWTKPVETALTYWEEHNQCTPTPEITALPDVDESDGSTVERVLYAGGEQGTEVLHFKVEGGQHAWPGSIYGGPGTNWDINASQEIWKFFSRFTLEGALPSSLARANPDKPDFRIYPNPARDRIYIEGSLPKDRSYVLYSALGRPVQRGVLKGAHPSVELAHLPKGVYFLRLGGLSLRVGVR